MESSCTVLTLLASLVQQQQHFVSKEVDCSHISNDVSRPNIQKQKRRRPFDPGWVVICHCSPFFSLFLKPYLFVYDSAAVKWETRRTRHRLLHKNWLMFCMKGGRVCLSTFLFF